MLDHILELPIHVPESFCRKVIRKFEESDRHLALASVDGGGIEENAVVAEDLFIGSDEDWKLTSEEFHDKYLKQGLEYYLRFYNWVNLKETRYYPIDSIISKYEKGKGVFHPHQDAIYDSKSNYTRSITIITYLNTVDEGGETYFPNQGLMMHPKVGSMLFFPSGFTHAHEGRIPLSNDKYIIVSFASVDIGADND